MNTTAEKDTSLIDADMTPENAEKTGLISEIEKRYINEVANFKVCEASSDSVTAHKEKEVAIRELSDLFDKALADGDYATILKLDKLALLMESKLLCSNTTLTEQSREAKLLKIDSAIVDNRLARESLDLIQSTPEKYVEQLREDFGENEKFKTPPSDRCNRYAREQSIRLGHCKSAMNSAAEMEFIEKRQEALRAVNKHHKTLQYQALGLKMPQVLKQKSNHHLER